MPVMYRANLLAALVLATGPALAAQAPGPSPGVRYGRLLIRNVMVIDGAGNPARGPMDIFVEGATIRRVAPARAASEFGRGTPGSAPAGGAYDRVIDGTGMYVTPGIIDVHAHIQFERNGVALPKDYEYKLLLAHGITTIRDPGSGEGLDTVVAHARL